MFLAHAFLSAASGAVVALVLLSLLDRHLADPGIHHFDLAVQQGIHAWENVHLTRIMLALTWIGSIKIFATSLTVVLGFLVVQRHLHAAAVLAGAVLGALVLNESFKEYFHRARPNLPWSIGDEHTFSFPSGHSLFSVVLYGTLACLAWRRARTLRRRAGILVPAILLPLGIGLSRIYLGMHYPTDVLAGYLTGLIWLATFIRIDRLRATILQHPSDKPPPQPE